MEIYEARDILESNGYLVERTPLEARTDDRFNVPKISKLDDVKKEKEEAMFHLFSDTDNQSLRNAFKLLFKKEFGHKGMNSDYVNSRMEINEVQIDVQYTTFTDFEYLKSRNQKIFDTMLMKLKAINSIKTNRITIDFYEDHFKIKLYIDHIKGIDHKAMMSELRKIKENVGAAMYDAIQIVTKMVKSFNRSYERAWGNK